MIKLFAIPMICSVMSGPVMKDVSYHHEYGPQQAVVYDDESYEITLSADELNNYTWENYYNLMATNYNSLNEIYWSYVTNTYEFNNKNPNYDVVRGSYNFSINQDFEEVTYYLDLNYFYDQDDNPNFNDYKFYIYNQNDEEFNFSSTLTITSQTLYDYIKSAIQADIQANQTSSMPSIQDLFAQVTSAINAFIGSLGDAFTSVTALFWDSTAANPGPTFLGLLVLIGVGCGLVFAAYRVIKGLLHRI